MAEDAAARRVDEVGTANGGIGLCRLPSGLAGGEDRHGLHGGRVIDGRQHRAGGGDDALVALGELVVEPVHMQVVHPR